MFRYFILVLFAFLHISVSAQKGKYVQTDKATAENGPKPYNTPQVYKKLKSTSQYLTMRDGVKIAINVTLPEDLKPGEKIPAIIYQTRYWRGAQFNFPFSLFLNNFSGKTGGLMKEVILRGYALVAVDSRGSGASMGNQPFPWSEDEVKDGFEIVNWVVAKEWCNGNVGSAGISYSGTTAEFLATTQHPAIKAVVPMFSLYDVYDDISVPGGVQLEYFTSNWGSANAMLDKNKLPTKNILAKMVVSGVQPVKGEKPMLKEAVKAHKENLNVNDGVKSIVFRDDISTNDGVTSPDRFSPHKESDKIDAAGIAVYSISGYFDGNYQHAAVKRFLTLKNPDNKLILGPWEHGGWMNCSPHNPGKTGFNKASEILKFFDYHLKGIETGIKNEPKVHYYTMGEEKWKSSNVWPPVNSAYQNFYLQNGHLLNQTKPLSADLHTPYKVDSSFGTGDYTRWNSLLGKLKTPKAYKDWHEKSVNLPHFTTSPLTQNIEVTGHPIVHLYITSTQPDGAFFVYLEDIDENGKATYVTEGQLRALQRNISTEKRAYTDVKEIPHHSYLRKDGKQLIPDKVEYIAFDLYPVSYQFKQRHSIRISIAGADKDHFKSIMPKNAEWKIMHNKEYASYIELPIVK